MENRVICRKLYSGYGGVLVAALYGLLVRLSFTDEDMEGLVTLLMVVVLPTVIGCLPMLFANATQLQSRGYRAGSVALSVYTFLLCCYWGGTEEIVSIVLFAIPFTLLAGSVGLIFGWTVGRLRKAG
jgi:hypothetical protein